MKLISLCGVVEFNTAKILIVGVENLCVSVLCTREHWCSNRLVVCYLLCCIFCSYLWSCAVPGGSPHLHCMGTQN